MFFVYLLQSSRDDNFYIGQTDNVTRRVKKHNAGLVPSTRNGRLWKLIGYEFYLTRGEARWREYQLKHHTDQKRKFIQALLAQAR